MSSGTLNPSGAAADTLKSSSVADAKDAIARATAAVKAADKAVMDAGKTVVEEKSSLGRLNRSIKQARRVIEGNFVINRSRNEDGTPSWDNNEETYAMSAKDLATGPEQLKLANAKWIDAIKKEEEARAAKVAAVEAVEHAKAALAAAKVAAREQVKAAKRAMEAAQKAAARATAVQALAANSPVARFLTSRLAGRSGTTQVVEGAAFRDDFRAWAATHNNYDGADFSDTRLTPLFEHFGFRAARIETRRGYHICWNAVAAKLPTPVPPVVVPVNVMPSVQTWFSQNYKSTAKPSDRVAAAQLF